MPGEMGSLLGQREDPYVVVRDPETRTWRILYAWHTDLREMSIDDDIPDDHPAVTVITEAAFVSLIKEATILGVPGVSGDRSFGEDDIDEFENLKDEYDAMRKQRDELQSELKKARENAILLDGTNVDAGMLASQKISLLDKMVNTNDEINIDIIRQITKIGGNADVK